MSEHIPMDSSRAVAALAALAHATRLAVFRLLVQRGPAGLPAGLLTLFAPGDAAFAAQGEQIVAHGGLSLAEVIVPWVHVTQAPGASEVPGTWSQTS